VTLHRIHDGGVFDDATTDERRTRVYVRSGELGLATRADVTLMEALSEQQPPQRLHVVGPSGAGKTSLILRVVVDLVRRQLAEKFVSPGPDGKLDETSVENLYHNGVRVLGELDVDLVVAMHPRFETVDRVTEVIERLAMPRIDVPELPADADDPALARILERRMQRDGVDAALETVIDRAAVEELQVLYHERDRDLRSVLKLAHGAAAHALGRGSDRIEARDIRAVVAGTPQ